MTCAVSCGFDGLWVPLRSSKADMASIPGRGEPDRPEAALALLPTAGVLSVIRHMFPGRSCRVKPDERATRSTWNTQPCGPAAQDMSKAPDEHQKQRYARLVPRTARGCDEQLEEPKARGCASLADGVRGEEARRGAVARGSCPGPVNTPSVDGGAFCCIPTIRSPGRPGHGASSHPILPATSSPLPARSRCKRRHRSRTDSTRPVTQASNAVCQPARRSYSPMSTHGPAARCHQPVERRPDAPTASTEGGGPAPHPTHGTTWEHFGNEAPLHRGVQHGRAWSDARWQPSANGPGNAAATPLCGCRRREHRMGPRCDDLGTHHPRHRPGRVTGCRLHTPPARRRGGRGRLRHPDSPDGRQATSRLVP